MRRKTEGTKPAACRGGLDIQLLRYPSVPSTNLLLKEKLLSGEMDRETLVLADEQTAGRGRLGRTFYSPGGGLYMSCCLRETDTQAALRYTPAAAAAVCLALEEMTGARLWIKWVNDVYMQGRKVCGILCERVENWIVCGIGINLRTPEGGFPEEAGPLAGALEADLDREELAFRILKKMKELLSRPERAFTEYRERFLLYGREVTYEGETLTVRGIDREYRLLAKRENGEVLALRSGEVTLHGQL